MQIQDSAERVMRRRSHPRLVRAALERRGCRQRLPLDDFDYF
jgi:hypothetical protein